MQLPSIKIQQEVFFMGLLDGLEKLINEHGSAAILKERIALLNEQHTRVQQLVITLQEQISILNRENERLKLDNSQLQKQIEDYENALSHKSNPRGYVCDHLRQRKLFH